jgi:preprotein translocase subunit YajC
MTKMSALLFAQAQPAQPSGAAMLFQLLPFILMFAAMYFLLIAPQRKKQKEHEKMLTTLKPGDEILTTGGIFGTITSVKDDRFIVRVGENNQKVELAKGFVHGLVKKAESS